MSFCVFGCVGWVDVKNHSLFLTDHFFNRVDEGEVYFIFLFQQRWEPSLSLFDIDFLLERKIGIYFYKFLVFLDRTIYTTG